MAGSRIGAGRERAIGGRRSRHFPEVSLRSSADEPSGAGNDTKTTSTSAFTESIPRLEKDEYSHFLQRFAIEKLGFMSTEKGKVQWTRGMRRSPQGQTKDGPDPHFPLF